MSGNTASGGTVRGGIVDRTAVDPGRDAALISGWMNEPHVAPWWDLAGPVEVTADYLERQCALAHLQPWIVSIDGDPVAYVETYRVADDPLAAAWSFDGDELGWHLLVGPPERLGTGAAQMIGRAIVGELLRDRSASAVVCEPDERNARMLRYCEQLGHERVATLELPDKVAALMVCRRETFAGGLP